MSWYKALSLNERLEFLNARCRPAPTFTDAGSSILSHATDRPYLHTEGLIRHLTSVGLSHVSLNNFLNHDSDVEIGIENQPWRQFMARAYAEESRASPAEQETFRGFILPCKTELERSLSKLANSFVEKRGHVVSPDVEAFATLVEQYEVECLKLCSRSLALELHLRKLEGRLLGDTSEDRFKAFCRDISLPSGAWSVLGEHPLLTRWMGERALHNIAFARELLNRIADDWSLIRRELCGGSVEADNIVNITPSLGDKHNRGRSVTIIEFSSGRKIVYKPRPVGIDAEFFRLLAWINSVDSTMNFRKIKILDRGEFGWMEHVEQSDCVSEDQVRNFYVRQGGYLAALYAFGGSDMHCNNIIASGEHPVPVDLEVLFSLNRHPASASSSAIPNCLDTSVLATGMLPIGTRVPFDFGGLVDIAGEESPIPVMAWENRGHDDMTLVRARRPMKGGVSCPTRSGASTSFSEYRTELESGFQRVYRIFCENRGAALDFALAMADKPVRVVIRGTHTYSQLLDEATHPDIMRDALERDMLFSNLWAPNSGMHEKIVQAETGALERADIPLFFTKPSSTSLVSCTGARLDDYFKESGLSAVQKRLLMLSESDLERQLWFIRASCATQLPKAGNGLRQKHYPLLPPRNPEFITKSGIEDRVSMVVSGVAARIHNSSYISDSVVSWPTIVPRGESEWAISTCGQDLYDGNSGIALFLGYFGKVSDCAISMRLSRLAAETLIAHIELERSSDAKLPIGGFSGLGGWIFALVHLAMIHNEGSWLDVAERLAVAGFPWTAEDRTYDVIGGTAGYLLALDSLYAVRPSASLLKKMTDCGDRLISMARRSDNTVCWGNVRFERPLLGFSHGASGVAFALLRLYGVTNRTIYLKTALDAFRFENAQFDLRLGGWPDMRIAKGSGNHYGGSPSWCHGAVGIGMSRLAAIDADGVNDSEIMWLKKDIQRAFDAIVRNSIERGDLSLCHGYMGSVEFVESVSELGLISGAIEKRDALVLKLLDTDHRFWEFGLPIPIELPGLMLGLSGFGMGLLRHLYPAAVPSVLTLSRPPTPPI